MTCGRKDLEITIVLLKFFNSHFKSNLFNHFHHHREIGEGRSKRIIHTPPPNILEGNGVVFANYTFNNL